MVFVFFFSSRRRHTRYWRDWSSDVCSSDLGYLEDFMRVQESFLRHYAEHPEEFRMVLALSERIAALAELPEESREVERLVEDYVRYAETSSLPEEVRRGPEWTAELMGSVFFEIMTATTSPAQRRFFELCQERLDRKSTRLNSSHANISYAVFCLKKKKI